MEKEITHARNSTTKPPSNEVTRLRKQLAEMRREVRVLRESEQRYRHLFDHSPAFVYLTDTKGVFIDVNTAGIKQMGFNNREEMVGKISVRSLYKDKRDRRRFQESIEAEGAIQDFETRLYRKDGTFMNVRITASERRNAGGKLEGYEGFVVDATDRKQAETGIKESEEKYRSVVENSLAGIFVHRRGIMLYANPRCAEMTGYPAEEMIGQPFWVFVHPDDRKLVKARGLKRERCDITPDQYTFRLLKKNGSTVWVDMRATRVAFGGPPCVLGNLIDITPSRQAEAEIRHLSRRLIEAIEEQRKRLAADLHDEYGQLLTSLHLDTEALGVEIPQEYPMLKESCRHLIRQIEHLAQIVRDTTSRLRPDLLDHLGLVPTLEWYVADFMKRRPDIQVAFQVVGLKRRLNPQLEIVLYRTFQECLTNISRHSQARHVSIALACSHPYVIFSVRDDGVGFDRGPNIFSSGKAPKGIGLLSMRERVAFAGGIMDIHSEKGKGTTIRVELPLERV